MHVLLSISCLTKKNKCFIHTIRLITQVTFFFFSLFFWCFFWTPLIMQGWCASAWRRCRCSPRRTSSPSWRRAYSSARPPRPSWTRTRPGATRSSRWRSWSRSACRTGRRWCATGSSTSSTLPGELLFFFSFFFLQAGSSISPQVCYSGVYKYTRCPRRVFEIRPWNLAHVLYKLLPTR